jgi:hypothetical protein
MRASFPVGLLHSAILVARTYVILLVLDCPLEKALEMATILINGNYENKANSRLLIPPNYP